MGRGKRWGEGAQAKREREREREREVGGGGEGGLRIGEIFAPVAVFVLLDYPDLHNKLLSPLTKTKLTHLSTGTEQNLPVQLRRAVLSGNEERERAH